MMLSLTAATVQPLCVQIALNARYSPGLGWVTTIPRSARIRPPLTGTSLALPSVSTWGLRAGGATDAGDASSEPHAASTTTGEIPAAPARAVRLVWWDIGFLHVVASTEGTIVVCLLKGS